MPVPGVVMTSRAHTGRGASHVAWKFAREACVKRGGAAGTGGMHAGTPVASGEAAGSAAGVESVSGASRGRLGATFGGPGGPPC